MIAQDASESGFFDVALLAQSNERFKAQKSVPFISDSGSVSTKHSRFMTRLMRINFLPPNMSNNILITTSLVRPFRSLKSKTWLLECGNYQPLEGFC